jgi:hypothetical protein
VAETNVGVGINPDFVMIFNLGLVISFALFVCTAIGEESGRYFCDEDIFFFF